ncbi:DUF2459 domain-containing protein [Salinarimonas soli]|uniref:DUF2459 domain-containing protein n=1 Tax=Salinarimonas soli TaxID=1638099 RepID=A0A5B2VAC3_9HYPH|nr:DUF2459 domain-containing protein [Salinarimonas soli]KAA2235137.1 DUF2459 domain-containing protein [Salinarimonas soli]
MVRRRLARAGVALLLVVTLAAGAVVLTARGADPALWPPKPGEPAIVVHLVTNGFHTGLVLPRERLLQVARAAGQGGLAALAQRFEAYEAVEIGWGEARFYRAPAPPGGFNPWLALRALLWPGNGSVLHVVGLSEDPGILFQSAELVDISLTDEGFARLVRRMGESVAVRDGGPVELGQGLYGPSLFYEARGTFSAFNVCNHWAARLLAAAGLPSAPVLATYPAGLLLDLRVRAGLVPRPRL